jgi:D-alanine--poly(phosphoribitol) ligase subunit 1
MIDVAERMERAFALHAGRAAVNVAGVEYTYADLHRRSLAIQNLLDAQAAPDERLIGLIATDTLDSYASIVAILRSGRAFVPLNAQHPPERNRVIVQQAGLRTVLVAEADSALRAALGPASRILQTADSSDVRDSPVASVAADDLAYLLFTSGSTGVPKGVPITRSNLTAFIDALAVAGYSMNPQDRVLQMFDLTFDFSIAAYLVPFCSGACVVAVSGGGAKFTEIYRHLEEDGITVAPLVPSVLTYLRPYFSDIHLPQLRLCMFCGEALYADTVDAWMHCAPGCSIANFYGPTEVTVFALVYDWRPSDGQGKQLNGVVSIGRPMDPTRAIVVNEELALAAAGEQGELCIAGPQLTPGYWRDPERNRRAFLDRPCGGGSARYYRTGDLVVCDPDGDFYFCGRLDHQVKANGYRVELGEIEHHARELMGGRACVVVAGGNRSGSQELSLIIEGEPADSVSVLGALRSRLPGYMIPARIVSMPRLPMNANGKIDRVALQRRIEGDLQ